MDITTGSTEYLIISHANSIPGLAPLADARTSDGLIVRIVDVADIYDQFNYGIFDAIAISRYISML